MRARDRLTMATTIAVLATSVLALGGASRWAIVSLVGLAALAAVTQIESRRRFADSPRLLWLIGIAAGLTLLQAIPLPESIVEWLNPTGFGLATDSEALLAKYGGDAESSWRPLSLDPPMTHVELAKFAAYFLIGWSCLRIASSDRGRVRLLVAVAGMTGLVAGASGLHSRRTRPGRSG